MAVAKPSQKAELIPSLLARFILLFAGSLRKNCADVFRRQINYTKEKPAGRTDWLICCVESRRTRALGDKFLR